MMTVDELDKYIAKYIQGGFGPADMAVMKEECEKLQPGDVYVEIGVDEGRSARVAHEYLHPDVYKIYIDIHDPDTHPASIGRRKWMEQEGMVGLDKRGFYIHGDADHFADFIRTALGQYGPEETFPDGDKGEELLGPKFVSLIFIDGHHDYQSVKGNTLMWEPFMKTESIILFHDYDHPDTKKWLDEHYGNNKEVLHGKIVRVRK